MNHMTKLLITPTFFIMLVSITGCSTQPEKEAPAPQPNVENPVINPMALQIIVASTRPTKTGINIAENIKTMIDKRPEVTAEIVQISTYELPFYADDVAPARREGEITDPAFKKWSDKIKLADGYIIVSPEYNAGYPASLKNAFDGTYTEWNNKPVAFVGYSGSPSGGASMIAQLRQVAQGLQMIPVATDVKIPESWKAFNENGTLVDAHTIEQEVNAIINQLIEVQKSANSK